MRAVGFEAEMDSRDASGKDPRVVASPVDRTGIRRDAVLLKTLGALADRPTEVDAGNRGTLPPWRLDGQPAGAEGRDAKVGQVLERGDEARRGDDIIDLDREVGAAVGPSQMRRQPAISGRFDPIHRRIKDAHAAAKDEVLERLEVARPDTDERLRI